MKKLALFALIGILTTGCISTKVKDFTDPDYQAFTAKKILIGTPTMEFDEYFINKMKEYDLDVVYTPIHKLFLPTRQYTVEQRIETIRNNKFDSYLAINVIGDTGKKSQVVGYNTSSSATAYGTGNYASASGSSSTTPVVSHRRSTQSKATLFDPETQKTIWMADLETSAKGSIYTGTDDAMEDISKTVIESLIKAGHLKVKAKPKAPVKESY